MRPGGSRVYNKLPLPPWPASTVETLGGGQYHLFITEHLGSCSGLLPRAPSSLFPSTRPLSLPRLPPVCFSPFCPDLPMPRGGRRQRAGQPQPRSGIWGRGCHSHPSTSGVHPLGEGRSLTEGHLVGKCQSQDWAPVEFVKWPAPSLRGAALGCRQGGSGPSNVRDRTVAPL